MPRKVLHDEHLPPYFDNNLHKPPANKRIDEPVFPPDNHGTAFVIALPITLNGAAWSPPKKQTRPRH